MTTLRQAEANRLNARHSTGPRSDEGKDASKRNALKHGLAGAGVVLPDDEEALIRDRFENWAVEFRPRTDYQRWLVEVIATNSVRLDRCARHEREERTTQSVRAGICWDDDHQLAAAQLGQVLSKRPAVVASQLEQTPHGCDWLIDRWESLGRILIEKGDWSEAQRGLALDLLGTPAALREDSARLGPTEGLGALVRGEIDRLGVRKQVVAMLDDRNRDLTRSGRIDEPTGPLANARRYEARCSRRLQWAMAQFFRMTLGIGLDHPHLGAPPLGEGDPTPLQYLTEMLAAPVLSMDAKPEPEPEPEPEPDLIPTPEPVPVAKRSAVVPIQPSPVPMRDRPALFPSAGLAPKSATAPLNRRGRRTEKARARHTAKV